MLPNNNPETMRMLIINPLSGSRVADLFIVHSSTQARIARLLAIAR
jgi:Zn-dependent protease with chaperone function